MPLPLGSLIAQTREDHASLDALVSEAAMQRVLRAEGHHVAGFGLWAVRRRARRQDVLERILRQPKDWTWLVFSPVPPGQLLPKDAELLARVIQGLHGVQYVQWTAQEQGVSFVSRSLRTTVVRGQPVLTPGSPRPDGSLTLPPGPLLPDLSRWAGVSAAQLGAALIEAAYVDRMAAADRGAFTNVDVLALAGTQPVVIEVKRRARTPEEAARPLPITTTQAGTLSHLRDAGCEVHFAVLLVPKGSTGRPGSALELGTWHAGAAVTRPGWGEMHVDLRGAMTPASLHGLRHAQSAHEQEAATPGKEREQATGGRSAVPSSPVAPKPQGMPRSSPDCPAGNRNTAPKLPKLKSPRQLVSFTFEYAFLRVWEAAPVKLGGRIYPSPAAAFLAARTLEVTVREALTEVLSPARAVRLAASAPAREDWVELRDRAAWEVLRTTYRGERSQRLVDTLPMLLNDPEVWGPSLEGLQGMAGLNLLSRLRGELATRQARQLGRCCLQCFWAQPGPWAGFLKCGHPGGVAGTLACVGAQACRGPGGVALVAVNTAAGPAFRSEQTADRP
ncbi:hypothetical protein ACFSR9_06975 [Deinococcus taklimakanensis]|uniref:DUF3883 domain-containing protein n=1 Tax=Deinococcus taklimakanensis TaxID=536443 RepID=A0ABW5P2Q7_9DEIO